MLSSQRIRVLPVAVPVPHGYFFGRMTQYRCPARDSGLIFFTYCLLHAVITVRWLVALTIVPGEHQAGTWRASFKAHPLRKAAILRLRALSVPASFWRKRPSTIRVEAPSHDTYGGPHPVPTHPAGTQPCNKKNKSKSKTSQEQGECVARTRRAYRKNKASVS